MRMVTIVGGVVREAIASEKIGLKRLPGLAEVVAFSQKCGMGGRMECLRKAFGKFSDIRQMIGEWLPSGRI